MHKPATRSQWQIDYAIAADLPEMRLFQAEGFVKVYHEPMAAVLVRNDPRHAALIQRYGVAFFEPLLSSDELLARGRSPAQGARLLREISDYLAFREDGRIAFLFATLLRESALVGTDARKAALLEPTLRYNPESVPLLGLKAELLYRQGDLAAAGRVFGQALALAPDDYPARLGLGYLEYDQGRFDDAATHFAHLVLRYPQAGDAHYALGLASFKLCRKDQVRHSFEQFLALAPQSRYAPNARELLDNLERQCR